MNSLNVVEWCPGHNAYNQVDVQFYCTVSPTGKNFLSWICIKMKWALQYNVAWTWVVSMTTGCKLYIVAHARTIKYYNNKCASQKRNSVRFFSCLTSSMHVKIRSKNKVNLPVDIGYMTYIRLSSQRNISVKENSSSLFLLSLLYPRTIFLKPCKIHFNTKTWRHWLFVVFVHYIVGCVFHP